MLLHRIRLWTSYALILVISLTWYYSSYDYNMMHMRPSIAICIIPFHIQIMVHHNDRLLIWPKAMDVLMLENVRHTSKIQCICSSVVSLDLSNIRKRTLQRMRKQHKQELVEQWVEVVLARSATTKQVWKSKQVVSSSCWVGARFMANNIYRPSKLYMATVFIVIK